MKIRILMVLLFVATLNSCAEEIRLKTDAEDKIDTTINYSSEKQQELMKSSQIKLKNDGIILQNSITPVKDLKYESNSIYAKPEIQNINSEQKGEE